RFGRRIRDGKGENVTSTTPPELQMDCVVSTGQRGYYQDGGWIVEEENSGINLSGTYSANGHFTFTGGTVDTSNTALFTDVLNFSNSDATGAATWNATGTTFKFRVNGIDTLMTSINCANCAVTVDSSDYGIVQPSDALTLTRGRGGCNRNAEMIV